MKKNHSFQINSLLKMILIVFNFYLHKIILQEVGEKILFKGELIWNEWFIFIFIDIYNNLKKFKYIFITVSNFYKNLVKWALTEIESIVAGTTTLDRELAMPCLILNTITKYRKRSIQSQTTESLLLQRTQEQKKNAISIVVSVVYSLWSKLA